MPSQEYKIPAYGELTTDYFSYRHYASYPSGQGVCTSVNFFLVKVSKAHWYTLTPDAMYFQYRCPDCSGKYTVSYNRHSEGNPPLPYPFPMPIRYPGEFEIGT